MSEDVISGKVEGKVMSGASKESPELYPCLSFQLFGPFSDMGLGTPFSI